MSLDSNAKTKVVEQTAYAEVIRHVDCELAGCENAGKPGVCPKRRNEGMKLVAYFHKNPIKRWWVNMLIQRGVANPLKDPDVERKNRVIAHQQGLQKGV